MTRFGFLVAFLISFISFASAGEDFFPKNSDVTRGNSIFIIQNELAFFHTKSEKSYIMTYPLRPCVAIIISINEFTLLYHYSQFADLDQLQHVTDAILQQSASLAIDVSVTLFTNRSKDFSKFARQYGVEAQEEVIFTIIKKLRSFLDFPSRSLKCSIQENSKAHHLSLAVDKFGKIFHPDPEKFFIVQLDSRQYFYSLGKIYNSAKIFSDDLDIRVRHFYIKPQERSSGLKKIAPYLTPEQTEFLKLGRWVNQAGHFICQLHPSPTATATIACPRCEMIHYCSEDCLEKDAEMHGKFCGILAPKKP